MFNFNPLTIPNLALWLDANDPSTINNGRITDGGTVSSFRDKINNLQFKNVVDGSGPTYSFGMVNGKNVINFQPVYQLGQIANNRALGLTNLSTTTLNSATCSVFCVYVSTGLVNESESKDSGSHIFVMEDNIRSNSPLAGGWPNRTIYTGEDITNNIVDLANQRKNPSPRYIEADTTSQKIGAPAGNYERYVTYHEHVPNRNFWQGVTTSSNKVAMVVVRSQNNVKKCGFVVDKDEFLDDFATGNYIMKNFPLPSGGNRGIVTTGKVYPISTPMSMCIGSYKAQPYVYDTIIGGKYPLKGYFCELLYFNRFLDDDESSAVRKYLYKKWFSGKTDLTPPVLPPSVITFLNNGDVGPNNIPYTTGFDLTPYTTNATSIQTFNSRSSVFYQNFTAMGSAPVYDNFNSPIDLGTTFSDQIRIEVQFYHTATQPKNFAFVLTKGINFQQSLPQNFPANQTNTLTWTPTIAITGPNVRLSFNSTANGETYNLYIFSLRVIKP